MPKKVHLYGENKYLTMRRILFVTFLFLAFLLTSCKKEKNINHPQSQHYNIKAEFNIIPAKKQITRGDSIKILFKPKTAIDSVQLFVADSLLIKVDSPQTVRFTLNTSKITTFGRKFITAKAFYKGQSQFFRKTIVILPEFKPKQLTYKIIKTYPHDPNAYTQGFVFEDDTLFESTGLKGESSIRKENLETGEIYQSIVIPGDIFGEGITLWQDKIILLTWQSHIGFVYDRYSLQKIGQFSYATEGWGLTNDGKNLIMSDGTNVLTYLDPNTYSPIKTVEVYDNRGPRTLLNELEYINGKIYANIYTKDIIAIINPKTGAVEAYIDMRGLLKPQDRTQNTDVLNGIAYDKKRHRLLVTGKNWPKTFWIKVIPK